MASTQIGRHPVSCSRLCSAASLRPRLHQNGLVRSLLELFLFLVAAYYLVRSRYSPTKVAAHVLLTEEEIDDLVEDWTPEDSVQE